MFKKFSALILSLICLLTFGISAKTPVFDSYADGFELYLNDASSLSQIVYADKIDYPFITGIYGESFKTEKNGFDLNEFFADFDATLIFSETIEEGTSYYAYSPKIKYRAQFKGRTINLQVFIGKQVTVGAPLIFGSF